MIKNSLIALSTVLFLSSFIIKTSEIKNEVTNISYEKATFNTLDASKYEVWGIDISHHQTYINWDKVMDDNPHFVFMKATEGSIFRDTRYKNYWAQCKSKKIARGAYHFFGYRTSGREQAANYIRTVQLDSGDFAPVLDVEYRPTMPYDAKVTKEIKTFLTIIEDHYKVKPIIYTSERYYQRYLKGKIKSDYPLWIADYRKEPGCDWHFWQTTDRHRVKGIAGNVDHNVFKGSPEDLHSLKFLGTPVTE